MNEAFWSSAAGLFIVIVLLGVIGIVLIAALAMAWRNYNRRDTLLDQDRRLRPDPHRETGSTRDIDIWSESGRRVQPPSQAELDEVEDKDEDDDEQDSDQPPRP